MSTAVLTKPSRLARQIPRRRAAKPDAIPLDGDPQPVIMKDGRLWSHGIPFSEYETREFLKAVAEYEAGKFEQHDLIEVEEEDPNDPFWSEANQKRLRKSIAQAKAGNLVKQNLIRV